MLLHMHVGVVITKDPVDTYVPLCTNDGNVVAQYTMVLLEELGLLKMDFLGLRTLSVISNCLELVKKNRGIEVEFDEKMDDPEVYKLWQEGKTFGIFQFESAGITSFMKDLKLIRKQQWDIEAIKKYGPTPIHRMSFIKNFV